MPSLKQLESWIRNLANDQDDPGEMPFPDEGELRAMIQQLVGDGIPEQLVSHADLPRLRPVLVSLAAGASGASEVDPELHVVAELLHLTLTAHDLAIGAAGGRRRWIARKVLRTSASWIGGNHLLLRAMEIARHAGGLRVVDELLETARSFSDAQQLSQRIQESGAPDLDDWEEHAAGHSGALFAFCCRAGGLIVRGDDQFVRILGRYGRILGRLWHMAEDVSLLRSPKGPEHLIARSLLGRPMYPLVVALQRDAGLQLQWRNLVADPRIELAEPILQKMEALGAFQATREHMVEEHWAALQQLRRLPESGHRTRLEWLTKAIVQATFERPKLG